MYIESMEYEPGSGEMPPRGEPMDMKFRGRLPGMPVKAKKEEGVLESTLGAIRGMVKEVIADVLPKMVRGILDEYRDEVRVGVEAEVKEEKKLLSLESRIGAILDEGPIIDTGVPDEVVIVEEAIEEKEKAEEVTKDIKEEYVVVSDNRGMWRRLWDWLVRF